MSKKEFVDAYAKATGETKKRAEELVNAFLETAEEFLVKGENIQFVGWGTFEVKERAAREGRNPSTGDPIQIEAKKVVKETAASSTTTLTPEMENDTSSRNTIYKKEVRNVN